MMKKIIATIASLAMLAGSCAMPIAAEETTTYALGDVNMDGKVDIADVRAALKHYIYVFTEKPADLEHLKLSDEQLPLADVFNNDGVIDTRDAHCILCYYAYTLTTDEPISSEEYFKLSRDEKNQLPMVEVEFPDGRI